MKLIYKAFHGDEDYLNGLPVEWIGPVVNAEQHSLVPVSFPDCHIRFVFTDELIIKD